MDIYILIGAPASGKSTWAKENFNPKAIISSDEVREFLYGDPTIQGNPWKVVYAILETKLEAGHSPIVFDATNVRRKNRRQLLNFIRTHAVGPMNIYGVVFDVDKQELYRRNENRDREVPKEVINNMCNALYGAYPQVDEGFTQLMEV